MSEISISRKHGKTLADARAAAEHMASALKEEFGLSCRWNDDTLHFQRSGISGQLELDHEIVALNIQLSFLFAALKPSIEREVHKFFDENFAT